MSLKYIAPEWVKEGGVHATYHAQMMLYCKNKGRVVNLETKGYKAKELKTCIICGSALAKHTKTRNGNIEWGH